jgi:hypothetical protein
VFVSLGLGSVIATTIESAPWLAVVGRHKGAIFAAVAVLLAVNYRLAIVRPRRMNCAPGEACHIDSPAMRISRVMYWSSVAIWAGAIIVSYAALWWVRQQ